MDEREDEATSHFADPDSLLGMLQRGRGKGFLMALQGPPEKVWPVIFECITNDPRSPDEWSPDADYYASLVLKTGMDLSPLLALVKGDDDSGDCGWDNYYTVRILRRLAHRGSRQALEFLREYVEHGYDFEMITDIVADDLAELGALEGIAEMLCRGINDDPDNFAIFREEVEEAWRVYCGWDEKHRRKVRLFLPVCEPWKSLCNNRRLAGLFAKVGLPYDQPPGVPEMTAVDVTGLSVEDLLASVNPTNIERCRRAVMEKASAEDEGRLVESLSSDNEYRVKLAFCGLGKLGTPRAFEAIKSYFENTQNALSGVRMDAFHAIEQIPGSLSLETARQWFGRDEWYLQVAAGRIFEHQATLDDAPLLIQALRTPETIQEKDSRLPFAVRAMARFESYGRIPELERVFCELGDPYDRGSAAKAMAATSPEHFASEYAFECLWDSDWLAFKTGCAMVDLSTPGAIERLQELAADPFESDGSGEVAKERLEAAGRVNG